MTGNAVTARIQKHSGYKREKVRPILTWKIDYATSRAKKGLCTCVPDKEGNDFPMRFDRGKGSLMGAGDLAKSEDSDHFGGMKGSLPAVADKQNGLTMALSGQRGTVV